MSTFVGLSAFNTDMFDGLNVAQQQMAQQYQFYTTATTNTDNTLQWIMRPGALIPTALPPAPAPVDDSPRAWLRRRVSEITDLAPKVPRR